MASEQDPLDTLRARLYAPKPVETVAPETLSPERMPKAQAWTPPPRPIVKPPRKKLPPSLWFLIAAAGFFVVAGIIAAGFIILGGRSVSTSRVKIDVQAPTTIGSGDSVPLLITIQNNNPVPLTAASITVKLPDGAKNADDPDKDFPQYSDTLGDIAPGSQVQRTVRAVLFGPENQQLTIPIHIEYHTPGSNAVSVKDQNYVLTVTTSPVSVNITGMTQVTSGQPVTLRVSVHSNATTPLSNLALLGEYPPGFVPTSSNPAPTSGAYFPIGTLAPGEEGLVTVTGTLTGSEGDQRVFHFTAGTAKSDGSAALGLSYTTGDAIVAISKPLIGLTVSLNRQNDETVTAPVGQAVQGTVSWKNSLPDAVGNVQVSVKFSGSAFDPQTVVAQNGFYRSSDATIIFDKNSNPNLALLQPNDSGSGAFSFTPRTGVRTPTVTMQFTVSGVRAGSPNDTITSTLTRTVRIGTGVSLTSTIKRVSGPTPPTPNQETTYNVTLVANNSINGASGAVVTAVLPQYVRWTGVTNAGDAPITYDESTRTVSWAIGTLAAGANKQGSFQVALLPSTSQEGTSPIVIPTQKLTAIDQFTQAQVTASADALTAGVIK